MSSTQVSRDDTYHDCAVCEKRTSTCCSACRSTFFCSTECQKMVWSTHKAVCASPPDTFCFAPLSAGAEKAVRDRCMAVISPFEPRGYGLNVTALELARQKGWWTGSLEDLLVALRAPLKSCTVEEPRRSHLLATLYALIHPESFDHTSWKKAVSNPWTALGWCHLLTVKYSEGSPSFVRLSSLSSNAFSLLNSFYRQYIVYCTLVSFAANPNPPKALGKSMLHLASRRLNAEAAKVPLAQEQVDDLKGQTLVYYGMTYTPRLMDLQQ